MPWKFVWEPEDSGTEKDRYSLLERQGKIFPDDTGIVMRMMPPDFIERCQWADTAKRSEDDCIIFCYSDGTDPRTMPPGATYPTYKGTMPKRFVLLHEAKAAGHPEWITERYILAKCGDRFCVNKKHLKLGGVIKNQHTGGE